MAHLHVMVPKDLLCRLKSAAALESLPLYEYVNRKLAAEYNPAPPAHVKPSTPRRT